MKVSYNWLQTYFNEPLPAPEALAELLTFHVFEIESIEKKTDVPEPDAILDVKVLPDRACYALSHWGIAKEISYITGLALRVQKKPVGKNNGPLSHVAPSKIATFTINDPRCHRASFLVITNLKNGSSSDSLIQSLQSIDQRPISAVVDATNFVMYDMGQPIHAFDTDKLVTKGGKVHIVLAPARKGEQITILGGKVYTLDESVLVFADANDHNKPLDIAGIKGGTAAQISADTKNIVVMAANFDPAYIRRTSKKLDLRTDASKRSENGIPLDFTLIGLAEVATLIKTLAGTAQTVFEGLEDYYPAPAKARTVSCSLNYVNSMLGSTLSAETLEALFGRLNFDFKKTAGTTAGDEQYVLHIPYDRLDISIPQDVVEEVGRIYGYDRLPATLIPVQQTHAKEHPDFYYGQKIRDLFVGEGFSEVYTYSLLAEGEVSLANPLASDKSFLRATLTANILQALEFNAKNADLLGLSNIQIFEIGTVFPSAERGEHISLAFGCMPIGAGKATKKWNEDRYAAMMTTLSRALGIGDTPADIEKKIEIKKHERGNGLVAELNLSALIATLPQPTEHRHHQKTDDSSASSVPAIQYKPFSPYPFIVRDIALFVPETVQEKDVEAFLIAGAKSDSDSGSLLPQPPRLFDVFTKQFPDGSRKTSYAFRLVFQSPSRTLTDAEVGGIMERITTAANARSGWQVR
jgi:phenylalanyl-tRNA synthetase beta chain